MLEVGEFGVDVLGVGALGADVLGADVLGAGALGVDALGAGEFDLLEELALLALPRARNVPTRTVTVFAVLAVVRA